MRKIFSRNAVVPMLAVVLVAGYVAVASIDARPGLATTAAQEKGAYKPVAELEVVMEQVDDVFGAFKENLEKKKHRTLVKHAMFLAEMMNLTSHYDHKKFSEAKGWEELCKSTTNLLVQASEAAKKKDDAAFTALQSKIDAACEACHEKYRDI